MCRSDNAHFLVILATRLGQLVANDGPIYLLSEFCLTIKDDILVLPSIRCNKRNPAALYKRKQFNIAVKSCICWYMTLYVLLVYSGQVDLYAVVLS